MFAGHLTTSRLRALPTLEGFCSHLHGHTALDPDVLRSFADGVAALGVRLLACQKIIAPALQVRAGVRVREADALTVRRAAASRRSHPAATRIDRWHQRVRADHDR
eukprot:6178644-Pleurochrysis_carterae.AAC.1